MKFFEVVGQVRKFTKKFPLVRKLIDFFPTLRNLDRAGFTYSRIKAEEQKVNSYLSSSPRPKIRVVCDMNCTPPTYGDFSTFLMSTRILSKEFDVTFVIVISELRSDWEILDQEEQRKRLGDMKNLARRVTFASDSQLVIADSFEEFSRRKFQGQTIFSDYVSSRRRIYWDLKILNDVLFNLLGCTQDVLLDRVQFSDQKIQTTKPYVLWHIRQNSLWMLEGDSSESEILERYKILRKVIGNQIEIVVCSSDSGLQKIFELAIKLELDIKSARDYSKDFLGDLTLLFNSLFFVQIGGGGLGEFSWSSTVPFLDLNQPLPKNDVRAKSLFGVNFKKGFATSWQNSNQVISISGRSKTIDFESRLIVLFNDLRD